MAVNISGICFITLAQGVIDTKLFLSLTLRTNKLERLLHSRLFCSTIRDEEKNIWHWHQGPQHKGLTCNIQHNGTQHNVTQHNGTQHNGTQHYGTQHNNTLPLSWMSRFIFYYAECRYAGRHYAECRYAECHYADCRYADCRYAECRYVECRGAI